MYKKASSGHQRVLSHGKWSDWNTWDDNQPIEEQLRNIGIAIVTLDEQLRLIDKCDPARPAMVERKIALEAASREMKKRAGKTHGARKGFCDLFYEVARERLMPGQFKDISAEVHKRLNASVDARPSPGVTSPSLKSKGPAHW